MEENRRFMLSKFITDVEWLNIDGYSGHIATCCFSSENYHDYYYRVLDIYFPTLLYSAVKKRRAEFLAGRYLACIVLEELGHSNFTLLQGSAREPIWPVNISGSISHCSNKVICAANNKMITASVGIDIEKKIPYKQAKELWTKIINSSEYDLLCQQEQPFERLLTITFSAKESLFKALYPMLKNYFYFLDTQLIEIDMKKNTFRLELLKNMHEEFCNGRIFEGVFRVKNNEIITLINIQ